MAETTDISSGFAPVGRAVKPAIKPVVGAAQKAAKASQVKAVKVKVSAKIKKK